MPLADIVKTASKEKASKAGQWALQTEKTASGAARVINQSGYAHQMRAHSQNNFDPNSEDYKNSNDWAAQAEDKRWLIVIPHTTPK